MPSAGLVPTAAGTVAANLAVALALRGRPTGEVREALLAEARAIHEEDRQMCRAIGRYGADLLRDGQGVLTHCNAGRLACVGWGTALGVVRSAVAEGKSIHVYACETRPLHQGSRLTAWELQQYGIPFEIIPDGAAGYFLHSGQVQKVFFGADRIAANGDVGTGADQVAQGNHDHEIGDMTLIFENALV